MIQAVANATVPQITIVIGGSLRRRQLRHVRPRLRSALHLRLAQQPHRRDGRRAGGRRDEDRDRAEVPARGQGAARGADRQDVQGDRRPVRQRDRRRSTAPRICGTTASSTRATRAACSPSPCRSARESLRAAAQSHHLRRRADVAEDADDEVHPRARGAAPDLEDASSTRRSIRMSTNGRRKASSPPTSCSRRWAMPACWASTSRWSSAARASTSPTPW